MITNCRKNCMGTVSFDGLFPGMRKPQDFVVYPMNDAADLAKIQSDTRIGVIDMQSGSIALSRPRAGGAYAAHLSGAAIVGRLPAEELLIVKTAIMSTAHGMAGTNGMVYCDNSAAGDVFGRTE